MSFQLWGQFGQTELPLMLELFPRCDQGCVYCFSELNAEAHGTKPDTGEARKTLAAAIFKLNKVFAGKYDQEDPIEYCLRHRMPVMLSNTIDPFQLQEKKSRITLPFLQAAAAFKLSLYVLTKRRMLIDEPQTYIPLLEAMKDNCIVYVTLTTKKL